MTSEPFKSSAPDFSPGKPADAAKNMSESHHAQFAKLMDEATKTIDASTHTIKDNLKDESFVLKGLINIHNPFQGEELKEIELKQLIEEPPTPIDSSHKGPT